MLNIDPEVLAALITGGVSLVIASFAFLTAKLSKKTKAEQVEEAKYNNDLIDERLEALEKERAYVVCPLCGGEVTASSLEVHYHDSGVEENILRTVKEVNNGVQKKSGEQ